MIGASEFKVSGSWDGRRIVASADMPSLLRALPPFLNPRRIKIVNVATKVLSYGDVHSIVAA